MTSIARMMKLAEEREASGKRNKPQKGAARSQKRPGKPEAAAPAVVRKINRLPFTSKAITGAVAESSGKACPTCKRPFPMTVAERQRKHRAMMREAKA